MMSQFWVMSGMRDVRNPDARSTEQEVRQLNDETGSSVL